MRNTLLALAVTVLVGAGSNDAMCPADSVCLPCPTEGASDCVGRMVISCSDPVTDMELTVCYGLTEEELFPQEGN